jgi:hypothetical protein
LAKNNLQKYLALNYSMPVKNFKDSKVYKLAYAQATEIFEICKKFPNEEKFFLTDQVRRGLRKYMYKYCRSL